MKTILTTVGTSVFENYIKQKNNSTDISKCYEGIKGKGFTDDNYKAYEPEIKSLHKIFPVIENDPNASAEISTIYKISKEKTDKIILFTTDTLSSYLAAEVIKKYLENQEYKEVEIKRVKSLQVYSESPLSKENIESGFDNLIADLSEAIKQEKPENCILNISGGYKALVPFVTILGQLYKIPIKYIYENSNFLVTIDPMPIDFDPIIAESFYYLFKSGKIDEMDINTFPLSKLHLGSLITKEKKLTQLGNILLKHLENHELHKQTIGLFIEYVLYAYYNKLNRNPQKLKLYEKTDGSISEECGKDLEYDLILIDENSNEHTLIEIKSFKESTSKVNMEKFINKVKKYQLYRPNVKISCSWIIWIPLFYKNETVDFFKKRNFQQKKDYEFLKNELLKDNIKTDFYILPFELSNNKFELNYKNFFQTEIILLDEINDIFNKEEN